jgi:two-component system, OmpR family, sensor kinase
MRFTSRMVLLFVGLLGLAVVSTALVIWGARESRYSLNVFDLAHRSYQAHLSLSNHTYQLFKQFGDAMTIGDRDEGEGERELLALLRQDISEIRRIIAAEIRLTGEDRGGDLEHLARIEAKINKLLDEYQSVLGMGYPLELSEEWGRLSRILDERVDKDFALLIDEALARQRLELREAQDASEARIAFSQRLSIVVSAVGAIAALVVLGWLIRGFTRPVNQLIDGAGSLARGESDHRITLSSGGELGEIAIALNRMADEIDARQKRLEGANEALEQAVATRTAELERLLGGLKEAEEGRRRLLADVSHELRTPLTIIRGEAEIALRGMEKSAGDYREALTRCRDAAVHTGRLVDDLLFIARHESRETRLSLTPTDLRVLVPEVMVSCQSLWGHEGVSARFQSELEAAHARVDPGRLRQVLMILLDNAKRYGEGRIDVSLAAAEGEYAIVVSNNGPALSPQDCEKVFGRFYRGSNAVERYGAGVGLGLPVAKAIVEAHHGRISLDSKPGEGVSVSVVLPADSAEMKAA